MGFMKAPTADGEFKVFVKYNAKAGRWYTKDDKPEAEEYEVKNMTAVFDIPNIKTGWFLFAPGVAPVKQYDPSLTEATAKPGDGFKKGFELDVYSEKNLGGLREFASTAGAVIEAMNDLYDAFNAAPEAGQGKLPVVKCIDTQPVTGKHGTNYRPVLQIVSWVDRPSEMVGKATQAPKAAPVPAPSPAPSGHVPPPSPAPAMVGADDVDF